MRSTLALVLAISLPGCAYFGGAKTPETERFDCQVAALEPVVGRVLDAQDLVRDLYAGKADLGEVLTSLRTDKAKVDALVQALRACSAKDAPAAPATVTAS